jgi:hypothetical protein
VTLPMLDLEINMSTQQLLHVGWLKLFQCVCICHVKQFENLCFVSGT